MVNDEKHNLWDEPLELQPAHFFAISTDCHQFTGKKEKGLGTTYYLPDLSSKLQGEPPFAEVALGWSDKGLFITVRTKIAFSKPQFPHISEGDSIELFIDTRDVKTGKGVTRFCHHFCILPVAMELEEGPVQAFEMTKFRREDVHPLADPELISVQVEKKLRGCEVMIFLPSEILHGYDPTQLDRLGFTYRINRAHGLPQCFSASEQEVAIESHPELWASIKLVQ